jgi:hypothetical protein
MHFSQSTVPRWEQAIPDQRPPRPELAAVIHRENNDGGTTYGRHTH